ncbi:VanZ family protein [Streptomyces sp. NPDC018693]|uniref:VanZ family protein n=1 Tax=unclassified Streptomyces TaxID=2593676 RepID=UPI0037A88DB2
MFAAVFQHHYGYLAVCTLIALVAAGAAWLVSRRLGGPHALWWGGLAATVTGVFGVTFMDSGPASGRCVINHDLAEPFHTTQGLWNLALTVPLGLFALLALRRPLPALVGVVSLPLVIEFIQARVDGLGRVCDSADAEMNILGGLVGLAAAAVLLAVRGVLDWRAGAKGALVASLALLVLGAGGARPLLTLTHVDGTGLSPADSAQRQAVERAVREAFGDRYRSEQVYEQPCPDSPCGSRTVVFNVLSGDGDHPEVFGFGSLSWPGAEHLNIGLAHPVTGARPPSTQEEAYRVALSYMRGHYPWAQGATEHRTSPAGENAQEGWTTSWRWRAEGVLMPRALSVWVDRAGRVAQVDVTRGPTQLRLKPAEVDAAQAEKAVRDAMRAQAEAHGGRVPDALELKAVTLKALDRDGTWRAHWLVSVSMDGPAQAVDPLVPGQADLWQVDAGNGRAYDGTGTPVQAG